MMQGTMLVYDATGALNDPPRVVEFDRVPTLDELRAAVGGGYIEVVPFFTSIIVQGKPVHCVAFCDEDGKRKNLTVNRRATLIWDHALRRDHGRPLSGDQLVGPVCILYGDGPFMCGL